MYKLQCCGEDFYFDKNFKFVKLPKGFKFVDENNEDFFITTSNDFLLTYKEVEKC